MDSALVLILTVKTFTSLLPRTSSTRSSGLPLGMGMVPRTVQEELSKVCLTALINDWLKSSILPISSMMNIFLLAPAADPTWRQESSVKACSRHLCTMWLLMGLLNMFLESQYGYYNYKEEHVFHSYRHWFKIVNKTTQIRALVCGSEEGQGSEDKTQHRPTGLSVSVALKCCFQISEGCTFYHKTVLALTVKHLHNKKKKTFQWIMRIKKTKFTLYPLPF